MIQLLTDDFAESQVKKRVKKGGSLPSITMNIGVSRDNLSKRKSCSRNFYWKKNCIRGLNKKLTFAKDIYYTIETIKDASNQGCKIPYLRNVQSLHSALGVNLLPYPDKDLRLTIQSEYIFGHQIILGEVEYFSHLQ